ncbi:MAG: 4Fe-4S binding protein [Verrucomicrobiota bacterium]|nr:4Fe-4S binding protein [Verrucomicrobiota bacterium]
MRSPGRDAPARRAQTGLAARILATLAMALLAWGAPAFVAAKLAAHDAGGERLISLLRRPSYTLIPTALSPHLALSASLARRIAPPPVWLAVLVGLTAAFRRRWFCHHLCPTGLLAELAGRLGRRPKGSFVRYPNLAPWLLALSFGGAAMGVPLFVWLDPLTLFNGFFSSLHGPVSVASLSLGVGLALIVALSLALPNVWCYRLCPLGCAQELIGWLVDKAMSRRKREHPAAAATVGGIGRRSFLLFGIGGVAGWLAGRRAIPRLPIRPPGAVEEGRFAGLCARCGNCIAVCPEKIIRAAGVETGIAGLLSATVTIGPGYCRETCNACALVCPTTALRRMPLAEKRNLAIGTAFVTRKNCLAWNEGKCCMVCDEFCPYHAIKAIERNAVNCPEVDPEICRGCGACQINCPAQPIAILVSGIRQKPIKPVPDS